MVDNEAATTAERRALLTDREREIISGRADDVSDSYRYQTISRVRKRYDRLADDLAALGEHGELLQELRDVVCGEGIAASGLSEPEPAEEPPTVGEPDPRDHEGPGPEYDQVAETDDPAPDARRVPGADPREQPDLEQLTLHLHGVEFPASRDRDACIRAVSAAYSYLQERGKATMRDFVQDVMPEHPLGYDVPQLEQGDRFRGAWWRSIVRPGIAALPDVQQPQGGDRWWRHQEGDE